MVLSAWIPKGMAASLFGARPAQGQQLLKKLTPPYWVWITMFLSLRYLRYFDWISFFLIVCICLFGLSFVLSATYRPDMIYSIFFKKQFIGFIAGISLYWLCSFIDYRSLMPWGSLLYLSVIGLLLFTIIKGSIGMGAQRWIDLGILKIQPAELIKLAFPIFASGYLYTRKETFRFTFTEFVPLLATIVTSFLLILKQPDLGTALIFLFSALMLLWLSGISKKFFLYGFIFCLITAPLSWHILRDYQKKRVLVFLGQGDQRKERYQIEQSKIAIGSGGFSGKGYLAGTQNKLHFLPESRTDFIFAVICEEWGFLGALGLLLLYILLFARLLSILYKVDQPIIQVCAFGLIIHALLSMIINIAMVTGLLPIVGIPLPFVSYGLSNLLITFATLGLFNAISMVHAHVEL